MITYDAFISYSHAADGLLAPRLQQALQRFAKAWYQLRALRLFRDATTLSLTPGLWTSIEEALGRSNNFILLASPDAAASPWVQREVSYWLEHHGPQTLYLVLTEGRIVWDESRGDFDWDRTDALPASLRGAYAEEPLYLDLCWARTATDLSLSNVVFRNNVADLAASLHGRPKDELVGEDVRQHRRTRRVTWAAIAALVLLTVAALGAAVIASIQRDSALSLALGASAVAELPIDPERALLLATAAVERKPTPQAYSALRRALHASKVRTRFESISWPDTGNFSPDGELALITMGRVLVVETATGAVLTELRAPRSLRNAAFSPDGSYVIATTEDTIHGWESSTWQHTLEQPAGLELLITAVAFSRDGAVLGIESPDGQRFWRMPAVEPLALLSRGESRGRDGLSIDPAGRWAARTGSIGDEGKVQIHEIDTGRQVAELDGHRGIVSAVAFIPGGALVATASWDQTIRLWDTETWRPVAELSGHQGPVTDAAVSPDGRWLTSTSWDRTGRVWDLGSRSLAHELQGHTDQVEGVVFSAEGNVAVLWSRDTSASIWETGSWRRVAMLRGHDQPLLNVAVSADGRNVMTASQDQTARIWAVRPDEAPLRLPGEAGPGLGAATPAIFSPDGAWVATIERLVTIWELRTGRAVARLEYRPFRGFSPDSSRAVTGGNRDDPMRLWTTADWVQQAELDAVDATVEDVAFSPDGRWLVSADGYAGTARVWEAETGRLLATLEGHAGRVLRASFAPHGGFLVTASYDQTARVWSTGDWRLLAELAGHEKEVRDVDVSANGRWIATASDDETARIWDASTWSPVAVLSGHSDRVVDVRFSADDRRVVTSSWDDTARLWSTEDWRTIAVLRGHDGNVDEAEFGPQGRLVVTAGGRWLRIWDAGGGAEIISYAVVGSGRGRRGGSLELEGAQFSPDGAWVAVASNDGNLYLYPREYFAPPEELLALAKERTTRELTEEETARYLP